MTTASPKTRIYRRTVRTVYEYSKKKQLGLDKITTEQLPQFRTDDPLLCLLLVALLNSVAIVLPVWPLANPAGAGALAMCWNRATAVCVAAGLGVVAGVTTQGHPMPKARRREVVSLVDGIDSASEPMEQRLGADKSVVENNV